MPKDPLSSPHQHGLMCPPPNPKASDCNYLEHTEVEDLKKRSDTSVLKEAFFAKGDSLNWSKGALDSPMGTSIANPKK